MTRRTVAGVASDLKYDAENHLIQQGSTTYRYDGDGKLAAKLLANGTREGAGVASSYRYTGQLALEEGIYHNVFNKFNRCRHSPGHHQPEDL